jgi:sugar transferase (PEP-CTERM/EpsH1 system associated)
LKPGLIVRILFLTSRLPYPPNRGDRSRTFHLLRVLGQEHEITLVSFVDTRDEALLAKELYSSCINIHLILRPDLRSAATAAGNFWRRYPLQLLYYRSRVMQRLVDKLLVIERYEAVYVHLFRMAPYVIDHPEIYRIVDLTDVISHEITGSLPYRSLPSRFLYKIELPRIASYERHVANWAEETWLISDRDRLLLAESCPEVNLQTVPNGVDLARFFPTRQQKRGLRLLFVGNLDVFHNIDAISFLVNDILPRVRQRIPECTLDIIGAGKGSDISGLERNHGVRVRGFVPDLNRALNEASIFAAPLRFSAGVQNKILEAMAAGVPVVTTSNVNEGLDAGPGQDLLVGDGADELAAQIVCLLEDEQMRWQMGQAGRFFVEQRFSWQTAVERLDQIEQFLLQGRVDAI